MCVQVPEYEGLRKPKHHFLTHLALDIYRYGPPRGYWCMSFEAFNAVVKRAANRSNFKDEVESVMRFWSMKSAIALKKQSTGNWLFACEEASIYPLDEHND